MLMRWIISSTAPRRVDRFSGWLEKEGESVIKEIGSIFPLYPADLADAQGGRSAFPTGIAWFSLGREAIRAALVANADKPKRALLPAFTCQSVIDPFIELGWECFFYSIKEDLHVDGASLSKLQQELNPGAVLVHPYFGRRISDDEASLLSDMRSDSCILIGDFTQCFFDRASYRCFDYCLCSLRKWLPIPDGAFLIALNGTPIPDSVKLEANEAFLGSQMKAMELRGLYFLSGEDRLKQESIELNKKAERIASQQASIHRISAFSAHRVANVELLRECFARRRRNYSILCDKVLPTKEVFPLSVSQDQMATAPLYFPIRCEHRSELQARLASNDIYAPILWPVESEGLLVDSGVEVLYSTILAIPCDQRYDGSDMGNIAELLNTFCEG